MAEQKHDFLTSSEDSNSVSEGGQWELSPHSREKLKIEKKYKKKMTRVMETFIDRVDNQSSSGSCSSDENRSKTAKKRKYMEFLNGQKQQYLSAGSNVSAGN